MIHRGHISIWKDVQHHISWEKSKWKQRASTAYLLEWPESGTLRTANTGEDLELLELLLIAGGHAKLLWKPVLWFLTKLNILLPYHPAILLFGVYTEELKTCIPPNLHIDVSSCFIHNCPNLEATKMSFCGQMDKHTAQHPDYDILVLKKYELWRYEKTWRKLKHIIKWKPQYEKNCLLSDSNYMTFWKKAKLWRKKMSSFWGVVEGGGEKEMATHSSILAWRIPGTGEPGRLPSMGSHRVGHDWSDLAAAAAADGGGPNRQSTESF